MNINMTDTITPDQTKNSTTNVDTAQSIELLKTQIAELQAKLARNIEGEDKNIEFAPSQTNSNKELLEERRKGAILSKACDELENNIREYKELLPTSMKESVDNFMIKVEEACVDSNGLVDQELKRNLLAFLNCKTFFDIEGIEVPEHLQNKVTKVKNAKRYSLSIKDEINELLSHLPYITKKLREMEDRKKNANIVLDEFGNAKGLGHAGDSHYINAYCTGKITLEECKKNLSPDYKEKIHRYILATAKKSGYEVSQMPTMAIHNYAKVLEYVE